MSDLPLVLTDAGLAALINAASTGGAAVVVAQVGVTSTPFVTAPTLTALPGELKRLTTFGGENVGDRKVHVSIRDDSADAYDLLGFGLYLDDGTLFAVYGQADAVLEKSARAVMLLSADFDFGPGQAELIQFGSTDFLYPPATTERMGVIELATDAEVDAGLDPERAVTPKGVARILAAAKAYADAKIQALVAAAPAALDTLKELATALGDDANFAATVTNALALKAPLASPALTGSPTAPTQGAADDSTKIATTAFVKARVAEEATARGNADTTLQNNINAEATARANADTAEATARVNGDASTLALAAPPGFIGDFGGPTAPAGWLECNGAAVSRTTYAALFAAIGTFHGAGDGVNTFNVPDLRGEFVRGLDNGRGVNPGRVLGSAEGGMIESHDHGLRRGSGGTQTNSIDGTIEGVAGMDGNSGYVNYGTIQATGGSETRPRSVALLKIIKF